MKTLAMGLGNPNSGDNGAGCQVVRKYPLNTVTSSYVNIQCPVGSGDNLMGPLIGYDRAILIDAIVTHQIPGLNLDQYVPDYLTNLILLLSDDIHLHQDIFFTTSEHLMRGDSDTIYKLPVTQVKPARIKFIQNLLIESTQVKAPVIDNRKNNEVSLVTREKRRLSILPWLIKSTEWRYTHVKPDKERM
jgi:hypothetical protein